MKRTEAHTKIAAPIATGLSHPDLGVGKEFPAWNPFITSVSRLFWPFSVR
jgi:hypothetical protein